jgi:flavin reductase (DIM6/NTAB) family NADH-FMN oxidoreductase RutF
MIVGRVFFDVEAILERVESSVVSQSGDVLIDYSTCDFSHRLVQPPIVCYLVTTVDGKANTNCAPISMGNAVWGGSPNPSWFFVIGVLNNRQTARNLKLNGECVISYYPYSLMQESHIAGLPIPEGISEIDVARMTPVPSTKVRPCGIAECPNNIECRVVHEYPASGTTIFILKVVAVNVAEDVYRADREHPYQPGMVMCDLLYEVSLNGKPERINYMRMNLETIYRPDEDLGDKSLWTGTFDSWLSSEVERGRIGEEEKAVMTDLEAQWRANPDPVANRAVKDRLTQLLADMVWRKL